MSMRFICPKCKGKGRYLRDDGMTMICSTCKGTGEIDAVDAGYDT